MSGMYSKPGLFESVTHAVKKTAATTGINMFEAVFMLRIL